MEDFLVFSDVHLHNWKYGSQMDRSGYNTRLLDQMAVLAQIYGYAKEHDIHTVMFCGDLFHTHQSLHVGPMAAASKFFRAWAKEGIVTWMIPGNHDMADNQGKLTSLEALKDSNIVIDDMKVNNTQFSFLPYTTDPEKIKHFLDNVTEGTFAFMHSGVQRARVNQKGFILNDEILDPTWIPNRVRHVFIGHYHSYQHTPQWTIPGAPMHHGWGDVGDSRGFLHVTPEPFRVLPIGLNFPNFKVLDGTKEIMGEEVAGHYIKLTGVSPNQDGAQQFASQLRDAGARTVEFEISGKAAAPEMPGAQSSITIDNVVKKFIEIKGLPPELTDMGLQIMEGRNAYRLG